MKLVTVYNNHEILKAGVLSSHHTFLNDLDIIIIDNTNQKYESFSDALMSVLSTVEDTETLIITHQDVCFYRPNTRNIIEKSLKSISNNNIYFAGVAGKLELKGKRQAIGVNNIISGGKQIPYSPIDRPTVVETIDECVIITNKRTITEHNLFSDNTCRWHLYAADASLCLRKNGITTFVIPLMVNHLSLGFVNDEFFKNALYLLGKHGVKNIQSTNGNLYKRSIYLRTLKLKLKTAVSGYKSNKFS